MRRLIPLLIALAAVLATGCPQSGSSGQQSASQAPAGPPPLGRVVLVRSDLGLGDGEYVRGLDTALKALEQDGLLEYAPVGDLPSEMQLGLGRTDTGMPVEQSGEAGSMTKAAAVALVEQAGTCDLLVLSNTLLVQPALNAAAGGVIAPAAILVMDDFNMGQGWPGSSVPVYVVGYELRDVAFLAGVAVSKSSANSMITILTTTIDPHSEEVMKAASAGARYQANGAKVATTAIPVADPDGLLSPEEFLSALDTIRQGMGDYFTPNHYIAVLGRATPSVLQALTGDPYKAYLVAGNADYRKVRPAKVIGCMLKKPGVALELLLRRSGTPGQLAAEFANGPVLFGLHDGAVGFTDFDLYGRYNQDAGDIRQVVEDNRALIEVDELDLDY